MLGLPQSTLDTKPYRGRFAPSPTGALHLGSLACAMASYLDARAHDGTWIVRIEDIDRERTVIGADHAILETLEKFGLQSDEPVVWQSQRESYYEKAFCALLEASCLYGCACSRAEIEERNCALRRPKGSYPGTCRGGTGSRPVRSWRFKVRPELVSFIDRRTGDFTQNVEEAVGDFVVRRVDGSWTYQLCVVVDDAAQSITDIVRGEDLLDNTPRQLLLQQALKYAQPRYMHIALVKNAQGEKLSKQTKATAVDTTTPLATLEALMPHFGLKTTGATKLEHFWNEATQQWKEKFLSPA